MTRPSHDPPIVVRLSPNARRWGRPGQACPDAIHAEARQRVEGSPAPLSAIARDLGISNATLSRWALNGGWTRPPGAPPWSSRFDPAGWSARSPRLFATRRGLRAAEAILRWLERAPPPAPAEAGPALDSLTAALEHLDDALRASRPQQEPYRSR